MTDCGQQIADRVRAAAAEATPLVIRGGGSKAWYGDPPRGDTLDVTDHAGVVEYDPGELVLTCRAGTPLAELRALLQENGQHLPFDPPAFGAAATIGGAVACGFSGPARPWTGALRDYLLGTRVVNGRGEILRFGGQVMKNVAGYDVSRLMAGARGTLGVLLDVSFKVLPRPAAERTLRFACAQGEAIRRMNAWAGQPLPLSGAAWDDGSLWLRLAGAQSEVDQATKTLDGRAVEDDGSWQALREHELGFFAGDAPLWRLSLPPATAPLDLAGPCLVDWGGAQRWYRGAEAPDRVRSVTAAAGGHATLFRGPPGIERFHPLPDAAAQLQARIRQAFDPHGILNRRAEAPA
ncbi:MAG: glycolate oxidase subunit GlcE [Xanthomonadales bacterium]